jgi:hypothetical protein
LKGRPLRGTNCSQLRSYPMSLKVKSVERQEMVDRTLIAIQKAARNGGVFSATKLARLLLDEHPDVGISLATLQDGIARLAVEYGIGVELGDEPKNHTLH